MSHICECHITPCLQYIFTVMCKLVKSGNVLECYNPLRFIKHNRHCQKWQNVWVRGDPRACVSGFVRVCEGNSLVPSLSPCLCVARVCWSYREFCAAVHYSSVSQAEQCSPPVPDLKTLPRGCVCVCAHTHICTVYLCSCECVDVVVNVMPLFPSTTCSGVAGGPDQPWGNGKDYLLFLQRH